MPAQHLYPHALESVFTFCCLKELAQLACACKKWKAATLSMKRLDASYDFVHDHRNSELDMNDRIVTVETASILHHHVTELSAHTLSAIRPLMRLIRSLPKLQTLIARIVSPMLDDEDDDDQMGQPSTLPIGLRKVTIQCYIETWCAPPESKLSRGLDQIFMLPSLEDLEIHNLNVDISSALSNAFGFHYLSINSADDNQIDQVRELFQLETLEISRTSVNIDELLRPGHNLNLRMFDCGKTIQCRPRKP